jgi:dipeptidyl aminopeptidase/acylaminoacyl peptidase
MTVTGAGGTPIQYWLLKPPHFDATKKYPVVFLIHGGPQSSWVDGWSTRWNPSLWAAQGWVVAAPNPRGSTGFGQKFVDEISQDWCGKAMTDLDAVFGRRVGAALCRSCARRDRRRQLWRLRGELAHRTHEPLQGRGEPRRRVQRRVHGTRHGRAVVHGVGVRRTAWTATARRNFARCSPHLSADKIRTPTFVITNEQDFRVPVDQGLQLFTALRRNGVPAEGLVFQNEGHWVLSALGSKRWHESVFSWLHRYLAPISP